MHKWTILVAMFLSFTVIANSNYHYKKTDCDGKKINLIPGINDLNFMLTFQSDYDAIADIKFKGKRQGLDFQIEIKSPVELRPVFGNRYIMVRNGELNCKMTILGQSLGCPTTSINTIPAEEFEMKKSTSDLILTFNNYTDDNNTCNEMIMSFSRK